jgi:uncharacterized membrane protein YdjX (TVP38/TMEM64 family)
MLENFFLYINFINQNLENNYLIFFLIYFFSLIIFFSFSLPGGPILLIASGFFFGFYIGFFINIFSILIGSYFFVFLFARNFFNKFFNIMYLKFSNKLNKLIKRSSYEYLIIFRLIQGNPLFIQNLFLSFLNISKTKFILTSFVGFSPAIIVFTYMGSKLLQIYEIKNITYNDIFSKEFIFILIIIILFLISRIIYNYKRND